MAKDGYITVHLNFTEQQYFLLKRFVDEANKELPWSRVSVSRFCQYMIYDYVKRYFEGNVSDARANM